MDVGADCSLYFDPLSGCVPIDNLDGVILRVGFRLSSMFDIHSGLFVMRDDVNRLFSRRWCASNV